MIDSFSPAADRVFSGMEWLDEHGPAGWWERIDIQTLDIDDPNQCVLGQVFRAAAHEAGISDGYAFTVIFERVEAFGRHDVTGRGFCANGEEDDTDALWNAWFEAVELRRTLVNA